MGTSGESLQFGSTFVAFKEKSKNQKIKPQDSRNAHKERSSKRKGPRKDISNDSNAANPDLLGNLDSSEAMLEKTRGAQLNKKQREKAGSNLDTWEKRRHVPLKKKVKPGIKETS